MQDMNEWMNEWHHHHRVFSDRWNSDEDFALNISLSNGDGGHSCVHETMIIDVELSL